MKELLLALKGDTATHLYLGGFFFGLCLYVKRAHPVIKYFMFWPGILLHELAHYVVAFMFFAKPSLPRMIPSNAGGGRWVLGSVSFVPTHLNAGFVALAPFYCLFTLLALSMIAGLKATVWWHSIAYGYMSVAIFFALMPSREDWKIALTHPLSMILCFGLVWVVFVPLWYWIYGPLAVL